MFCCFCHKSVALQLHIYLLIKWVKYINCIKIAGWNRERKKLFKIFTYCTVTVVFLIISKFNLGNVNSFYYLLFRKNFGAQMHWRRIVGVSLLLTMSFNCFTLFIFYSTLISSRYKPLGRDHVTAIITSHWQNPVPPRPSSDSRLNDAIIISYEDNEPGKLSNFPESLPV